MRYDSDPQVVRKILDEAEALKDSLRHPNSSENVSSHFFDSIKPFVNSLLNTLDHFTKLYVLNPQMSLSRFSASYIERELLTLQTEIDQVFNHRQFDSLDEQVDWNRERFLNSQKFCDSEQILIGLYRKVAQFLDSYYAERIRNAHFAVVLNELVGWSEHIETHGHHDIHAVILFARKIARDTAIIAHRTELVREICLLLQGHSFFQPIHDPTNQIPNGIALELSRVYSPYLLELYETLLEDLEIVAIAKQDYSAFENYCHEHDIDVYEEYRDGIKYHLKEYAEVIGADISSALGIIRAANSIVNAEKLYKRYWDVDSPSEVLGINLSKDIRFMELVVQQFKSDFPDLAQKYILTLQKIKKLKGDIMKPAIEVYGQYLKKPEEFFHQLPQKQKKWIPVLESALACLEQDDDLYQKCDHLKTEIDKFIKK